VETALHAARNVTALLEAQAATRGAATAATAERGGRIEETSWAEIAARVHDLAAALASLGVARGDRVALLGATSLETVVADLAIAAAGAVSVPIYVTSTPGECEHVLASSGASWIFCDADEQADKVERVRAALPELRGVLRLGASERSPFERSACELARAAAASRLRGDGYAQRVAEVGRDDPACILYTSGTTGRPKGVVLSHGNLLYIAGALTAVLGQDLREDDVDLLFLPLAHAFARLRVVCWLRRGYTTAFTSIDRILEGAARLRPTFIAAPPRLYEKIHAGVVAAGHARRGLGRLLFRLAMGEIERATARRLRGSSYRSLRLALARRVVFPRIARAVSEKLGGRVRLLGVGSAPLSPRLFTFFEALGLELIEGFGMTECGGAAALNPPGAARIGTVGPPLPGTEVRIAEDGEILLRSPGVMLGYWREPDATREALRDGWLHTGDVGELDARGYLRITDRKKDIIATSGGKKVAPQNIEAALKAADPLISQAVVHGDRRKYLVALFTVDDAQLRGWAAAQGFAAPSPASHDPRVVARLQRAVGAVNAELPRYAQLKRFAILGRDLTVEAGELTPTMRVRRRVCEERHATVLDDLYREDG
jgi:long-chain acyl-CoA synthetase